MAQGLPCKADSHSSGPDTSWFNGTCMFTTMSHKPSTGLHPEEVQARSRIHTLFTEDPFQYYPSIYTYVSQIGLHFRFSTFLDPNNVKMMQNFTAYTIHNAKNTLLTGHKYLLIYATKNAHTTRCVTCGMPVQVQYAVCVGTDQLVQHG
jgi:hypothetical protein